MEMDKDVLSAKLETLRKNAGLTQKDVADILKINRTTYTKYETGVTEPNISSLRKLSEIFGVDLNFLLSEDDGMSLVADVPVEKEKVDELVKHFLLLSEKDRETVLTQIKKRTESKGQINKTEK